jgi:hypothetical protein
VAFYYSNFVERGDNVQFGIIFGAKYLVQNFLDQGQRVPVFDRYAVQFSVIVTYAYFFFWFFGQ